MANLGAEDQIGLERRDLFEIGLGGQPDELDVGGGVAEVGR